MPRYKGDEDPAMWGANRTPGKVLGGIPLTVLHRLMTDLIPEWDRSAPTAFNGLFIESRPDIEVQWYQPGGNHKTVTLPRAKVIGWLKQNAPDYAIGFTRRKMHPAN